MPIQLVSGSNLSDFLSFARARRRLLHVESAVCHPSESKGFSLSESCLTVVDNLERSTSDGQCGRIRLTHKSFTLPQWSERARSFLTCKVIMRSLLTATQRPILELHPRLILDFHEGEALLPCSTRSASKIKESPQFRGFVSSCYCPKQGGCVEQILMHYICVLVECRLKSLSFWIHSKFQFKLEA